MSKRLTKHLKQQFVDGKLKEMVKTTKEEKGKGTITSPAEMHPGALKIFRERLVTAVTAAFAFVIALAWNDTIKLMVDQLVAASGLEKTSSTYSLIAAIIITIIGVWAIIGVSKLGLKKDSEASK